MAGAFESSQPLWQTDALTLVTLSAVADNLRLWRINSPCTVRRIGIIITTATTVTAGVFSFDRRITVGSDTGRIEDTPGKITEPAVGSAIGTILYKDVNTDLTPGDEISFAVETAPTAGAGLPFMEAYFRSEVPGNVTAYTKSA